VSPSFSGSDPRLTLFLIIPMSHVALVHLPRLRFGMNAGVLSQKRTPGGYSPSLPRIQNLQIQESLWPRPIGNPQELLAIE
jgi:hypothetical protein